MEIIENTVETMVDGLNELTPGSEEYLNQSKAIAELTTANANDKKAETESKLKKVEKVTLCITAGAAVLTAVGKVLEPVLRRLSNKDWVKAEDEGFYVRNKDNK